MVKRDNLYTICSAFGIETPFKSVETLQSGHINDTYLVTQQNNEKFVVQKINHHVFQNIETVMANKIVVSTHLQTQYKLVKSAYSAVTYLKTNAQPFFYKEQGDYWNVMRFIPNALTLDKTETPDIAQEAGKLYGNFIYHTATINPQTITETLPNFHDVPMRFAQFEKALKQATPKRVAQASGLIAFAKKHSHAMNEIARLHSQNVFPIRITHNDTKITNILFDQNYKGLAVIDLDTVMPGLVLYDFGDSVRTICASTSEDDSNLDNIHINLELYAAFCEGFAYQTKSILTPAEKTCLPLAVQTLIYIMGLRFLTDFLNKDTYYKIRYEMHNFDRSSNQFALLQSVFDNLQTLEFITKKHFT